MRDIFILVLLTIVFSGCAPTMYTKSDIEDNMLNQGDLMVEELIKKVPSIRYCYSYSDEVFHRKMLMALEKSIAIVGKRYPYNLTQSEAIDYSKRLGNASMMIFAKKHIDNIRTTGLPAAKQKKCSAMLRDAQILKAL